MHCVMKFFSYPIILTKFINSYYSDENRSIFQLSVGNFVRRSKYENVFYFYLSNANTSKVCNSLWQDNK